MICGVCTAYDLADTETRCGEPAVALVTMGCPHEHFDMDAPVCAYCLCAAQSGAMSCVGCGKAGCPDVPMRLEKTIMLEQGNAAQHASAGG